MKPARKKAALPSGPEPLTASQKRRGLERSCAWTRGIPFGCMQGWASELGLTLVAHNIPLRGAQQEGAVEGCDVGDEQALDSHPLITPPHGPRRAHF